MEEKRERLRREGKAARFIPSYSTQQLTEEGVRTLLNNRDLLQDRVIRLISGEELEEEELMFKLHKDVYFALDNEVAVVHIRRFWWNENQQKWNHQRRGVAISLEECLSAFMVISELMEEM